ncbi:MAG: alpha/beta hydrolase [Pseudomonadota bacterium]
MSEKQDLILVPGLLCSDMLFSEQMSGLRDVANIRIGRVIKHDSLAGMAAAILRTAPPEFALAGLSLGGYVAFEIMRQAPERISRLALLNTNARADRLEQIKFRQMLIAMANTMGPRSVQAAALPMLIHPSRLTDRPLVDRILNMADAIGRAAFVRQQQAIIDRHDNRSFLTAIACPTVIIVGEQDIMTPVKVAREMQDGIGESILEVIPACGHLSTMERPHEVNAILRQWLAS